MIKPKKTASTNWCNARKEQWGNERKMLSCEITWTCILPYIRVRRLSALLLVGFFASRHHHPVTRICFFCSQRMDEFAHKSDFFEEKNVFFYWISFTWSFRNKLCCFLTALLKALRKQGLEKLLRSIQKYCEKGWRRFFSGHTDQMKLSTLPCAKLIDLFIKDSWYILSRWQNEMLAKKSECFRTLKHSKIAYPKYVHAIH